MQIYFKKSFIKQYEKLVKPEQRKVDRALELLENNPVDPLLKNHPLSGKLIGKRAISAGFDLRIIFEVEGGYTTVVMIAVGSHDEVY